MKLCPQCGHENPADYNYCENCGGKFSRDDENVLEITEDDELLSCERSAPADDIVEHFNAAESGNNISSRKKKWILGVVLGVLLMAVAVTVIIMYINNKNSAEYNAKIGEADKYMEELEYEKAESLYLTAIEIEPKKEDAYVKVADVYMVQERYEEAEEILKTGKKEAGGKEINKKLQQVQPYGIYDEFLKETLIPEIGLVDVSEQKYSEDLNSGLISALMQDFNNDRIPELLTVSYGDSDSTVLKFSLYTCKDKTVELLDETVRNYEDTFWYGCKFDVFIKTVENINYLLIGSENIEFAGGVREIFVYRIENEIELEDRIVGYVFDDGSEYYINDILIAEYVFSSFSEDLNNQYKIVTEQWTTAFTEAIEKYGLEKDRIIRYKDRAEYLKRLEYDETETSETFLCYIQRGEYTEDGSLTVADTDFEGNYRLNVYIEDKTGLRDRV